MNNQSIIIGVMGGGSASSHTLKQAYLLGKRIAEAGWILLNGGRNAGVMEASAKGASEAGGTTLGILPGSDRTGISEYIQIPILTGMGNARNVINVLSSHVVVACPGGAGTLSEIALAVKCGRPVILMGFEDSGALDDERRKGRVSDAEDPNAAVRMIREMLPGLPVT